MKHCLQVLGLLLMVMWCGVIGAQQPLKIGFIVVGGIDLKDLLGNVLFRGFFACFLEIVLQLGGIAIRRPQFQARILG